MTIAAPTPSWGAVGRPGASVPSLLRGAVSTPSATAPGSKISQHSLSRPAQNAPSVHLAVVRVVAPGNGSVSYGSGTLVDTKGDYGLVITNYHVINEATGNISVVFPDGFYSLATVRKVDRDWDLAALVIKRPSVAPVPLSGSAPRPGEALTIAGYGSGNYRAVSGRCTQYVSPGGRMPFEMVELAASARQGDSGGPILNSRGELAGVLFGEGGGRTAGSYCGRVQWFLASLTNRPAPQPSAAPPANALIENPPMIAHRTAPPRVRMPEFQEEPELHLPEPETNRFQPSVVSTAARSIGPAPSASLAVDNRPSLAPASEVIPWQEITGDTLAGQAKTFLAILGCCAVLLHALKSLGGGS